MNGNKPVNSRFIIFGGTGDLTYRKLLPAMYNMLVNGKLQETDEIKIIGRKPLLTLEYNALIKPWIIQQARMPFSEEQFAHLSAMISYIKMDISQIEEYKPLKQALGLSKVQQTIAYFAVAPNLFSAIAEGLSMIDLPDLRIVMEKPFGETLKHAEQLNIELKKKFGENNLYLIDHYLGKEMVRNILTIRCANPIFSAIWDHEHIESVLISASETVGVGSRANYFDHTGILKDMVQNHLLQLLSMIALEEPRNNDTIKAQQRQILEALQIKGDIKDNMLLGQYAGYIDEPNVTKNSQTETFAVIRAYIDLPRWHGVPFIITTGKRLAKHNMEVKITFRQNDKTTPKNALIIKIQPTEGVELNFNIKTPGKEDGITEAKLDFCQSCSDINRLNTPEAYEWMLESIMNNEHFWFSEWQQIDTSWRFINQLKQSYQLQKLPLHIYPQGSEINDLIKELL